MQKMLYFLNCNTIETSDKIALALLGIKLKKHPYPSGHCFCHISFSNLTINVYKKKEMCQTKKHNSHVSNVQNVSTPDEFPAIIADADICAWVVR